MFGKGQLGECQVEELCGAVTLLPPEGNDLHLALLSPPKLPLHSGKSSQHRPLSLASGPVCLSTWLSSPEPSTGTIDRSVPWPPRLRTVPCPLTLDARHPHSHVLPWPSGINPRDPTSDLEAGHTFCPHLRCPLCPQGLVLVFTKSSETAPAPD